MLCGGISDGDINDEYLISIVKAGVEQKNREAGSSLELVKLLTVTKQVVAGLMVDSTAELKEGNTTANYHIKVWSKPGPNGEYENQVFEKL